MVQALRLMPIRRVLFVMLGALLAALALATVPAAAAHADDACTGAYTISGNVKNNQDPLQGVEITAKGGGVSCTATTDANGQWNIQVPSKDTYIVTLNESTLPDGVTVTGDKSISAEFKQTLHNTSVNFFLGHGQHVTSSIWDQVLQRIFNGLCFGLLLALAAIGVSLIFGTTGLSNFAQGEMITFGAFLAYVFGVTLGWPFAIAALMALLLSAGLGWTMDAALWAPLRRRGVSVVQLMIVSIGLSLALRYVFQYIWGGSTLQLPGAADPSWAVTFGPITTTWINLLGMLISIVALVATALFLLRTRIGKATRAVSDNPALAAASGINVDTVVRIVWTLSGLLAGISGILFAYYRPGLSWDMGFQILLLTFAATTLGGLGSAWGALVGALILGLFTEVSTLVLPSDMKYVGALLILIVVLLIRPQGILGHKDRIG